MNNKQRDVRHQLPLRHLRLTAIVSMSLIGAMSGVLPAHESPTDHGTRVDAPAVAREMAAAASNFLAALGPKHGASYHMKDEERRNFHFFPIPRRGQAFKHMNSAQRHLAHALVSTGLSHHGYVKTVTIMSLGQLLRDTSPPEEQDVYRDSDQYYVTIFGTPEPEGTWGWRFEGFHVSLNFTIIEGRWIAAAPSFLGSIPSTVKEGPRRGLQVLRDEEEMARQLARSFDADQRRVAFGRLPVFEDTIGGFLTGNARRIEPGKPRGIPASRMTPSQRNRLMDLVRVYAHRHRRPMAENDMAKIAQAGIENIHFVWAGELEPGRPHHYLIQGPTFLIEYDNTQDGANHAHCIWRDFKNDFGHDLLRRHYERHHNGHEGRS